MLFKNKKDVVTEILILDDNSSEKINIQFKKLKYLKNIKILRLSENLGSQKAIAVSLTI